MTYEKDEQLLGLYIQIRQARRYRPKKDNSEEQELLGELEEMCLIQKRKDGRYGAEPHRAPKAIN